MPINFGGAKRDYATLPKPGSKKAEVFNVVRFEEVREADNRNNFKGKNAEDKGFHYICHLDNGQVFTLNVFKLFYALQEAYTTAGIEAGTDGVILEIGHPATGVWTVEILGTLDGAEEAVEEAVEEEVVEEAPAPKATASAKVGAKKAKVEPVASVDDTLDGLFD